MNTNLFESMHARVNKLTEHYLPMKESVLGDYSEAQLDDANAFILLAHAELEEYIECLASAVCDALVNRVKANRYDSVTSVFLMRTIASSRQDTFVPLEVALEGQGRHQKTVRANNGIKDKDYRKLFDPLGVDVEALNSDIMSESDTFGAKRGRIAHLGFQAGIQHNVNPYEERELIKLLLEHLKEFDTSIIGMFPELR